MASESVVGTSFDDYYAQTRDELSVEDRVLLEEAEAYYEQVSRDLDVRLQAKRERQDRLSTT